MTIGLRRSLAAVLLVALTLAGLGRALASTTQPVPALGVIAGMPVPICHAGGAPAEPSQPAAHDCCDECALLSPAVLPAPPHLAGPAPAAHFAAHARAIAWAPRLARPRGPRLSRGPPVA